MKRRDFFKAVTGFVAGAFGVSAKAKPETKTLFCKGKDGTLCPRCKFNLGYPSSPSTSTGIDPNSEWARQKPLTLDELIKLNNQLRIEADDTKAIQEAIDLASDEGLKYTIYLPEGTYNIKSAINIKVKGCQLNGEFDI